MTLLEVDGLDVSFPGVRAVREVSFTLDRGECFALVGESGSGKSVTARTLVGLTAPGARVGARRLAFDGQDLRALRESGWRAVRGRRIGLVQQDALVSLDPLRTVGAEVAEPLRVHGLARRAEQPGRVAELLAAAGIADPARRAAQYPHQLSGGLRQRALIASALAGEPELLIADEPTTALDVTVQAQVLDLLDGLRRSGTALLLISHDLSVVARLADRVGVMYGGRLVETGETGRILAAPRHPYTRALLDAVPSAATRGTRLSARPAARPAAGPDGCPYAARCAAADDTCRAALPPVDAHGARCWHPKSTEPTSEARPAQATGQAPAQPASQAAGQLVVEAAGLTKRYRGPDGREQEVLSGVSFELRAGEILGLVGESGSGKTTAARLVLGLTEPDGGTVRLGGRPWSGVPERQRRASRLRIQAVQQDPLGSFDPRFTVQQVVGEAVGRSGLRGAARRDRVVELLGQVGLAPALLGRRPLELSGGQRQRVAIARALAPAPEVLVCDEPVSALDVSVQAQILDLLAELRTSLGLAMLFISHDLGVVHHLSDRVAVMRGGRIVETGPVAEVFGNPAAEYTKELMAAVGR
ncbi:dipeptide ABC transporter ATP-binding protein [Kitasatospora sp. NPDC006697]|uniref:dipeptide ABC transporter ATP-binding protein n=1 Tax=Kitasatospora sp. NPDC006697 TaxID=3364020 RepID=UPI0036D06566